MRMFTQPSHGTLCLLAATALLCASRGGHAQTVEVPNASFESGVTTPEHWTLSEGGGTWLEQGGAEGARAVAVRGTGADMNFWRSEALPMEAGALYRLRFKARTLDASAGGTAVSGSDFANRDLGVPPSDWTAYTSYFMTPEDLAPDTAWLRFGQWHMSGSAAFDEIELTVAQPIYTRIEGLTLGDGERIAGNAYRFDTFWGGTPNNHCRPLSQYRARFNTNRWNFTQDSELIFRHRLGERQQSGASVEVSLSQYAQGELLIEGCTDGITWNALGVMSANATQSFLLPGRILPSAEVWVRLQARAKASDGAAAPAPSFVIDQYRYHTTLDGAPVTATGATRYAAIKKTDPRLRVDIENLGDGVPGGNNALVLRIFNTTRGVLALTPTLTSHAPGRDPLVFTHADQVGPGESVVALPYEVPDAGTYTVQIGLGESSDYQAELELTAPELFSTGYGERLPGSTDAMGLWWASSGWKVSRTRPAPSAEGLALRIRAARNEAEAAQLVLRPAQELKGFSAQAGNLSGPNGAVLPAENIDLLRVRYVNVTQPTDSSSVAAAWPDPLPSFAAPTDLAGGVNQPVWVRVRVPRDAAAGVYQGTLRLTGENYAVEAPLEVEVYDFTLPDRMSCTTAFGFSPGNVFQYQGLSTDEHKRAVLEKYWADFSAHHIAPYDPAPLDPFVVTWPTPESGTHEPTFDWTAWDAAMDHAIDAYHFNSFCVPIQGLGSGTFHDRTEPSLQGFNEGTPEYRTMFLSYCRQLEEHLRAKGRLDLTYVYWFDEPDPKDYDFVMNGFRKLKEAAPGLHRMLTEQVEAGLVGGPDIWCPITPAFEQTAADARRDAGDHFWWYICTGPKAPYCTLFLDHPATDLRAWLWQTWQRHIDGILVWQTNYWTSPTAYPDPVHPQNPYEDPMSWTSGYGTPSGARLPWGNGDGRFIYPPEAAADAHPAGPVLEGPVDSIRWEMLRDGIEDYEYLAMLRELLRTHAAVLSDDERQRMTALLEVPDSITRDITTFTKDPAPIEAQRDAVARAIVEIGKH